jgi:hypothetical protein
LSYHFSAFFHVSRCVVSPDLNRFLADASDLILLLPFAVSFQRETRRYAHFISLHIPLRNGAARFLASI